MTPSLQSGVRDENSAQFRRCEMKSGSINFILFLSSNLQSNGHYKCEEARVTVAIPFAMARAVGQTAALLAVLSAVALACVIFAGACPTLRKPCLHAEGQSSACFDARRLLAHAACFAALDTRRPMQVAGRHAWNCALVAVRHMARRCLSNLEMRSQLLRRRPSE